MRTFLLISGLWASACAFEPEALPTPKPPASVRDALASDGAVLTISADPDAGTITARQWRGRWEEGTLAIQLDGGGLGLSVDRHDQLALDGLEVALAPIALPDAVFGQPARLTDLTLALATDGATAMTTWNGPNAAHASLTTTLRLSWSLDTGGRITPLGPVTLRGLPIDLEVAGDPTRVTAELALHADGRFWSWAGLIELHDLALTMAAAQAP